MSNFKKAEEVLNILDWEYNYDEGEWPDNDTIVQALADAGLLATELPQANDPGIFVPGGKGWRMGDVSVWTAPDSTVMVQNVEPGDLSPSSARELAYVLLAAANYAEEKK